MIVGQTISLNIQMSLAIQQTSVTVTAENPLIETEKTEQSQAIAENLVANLPTNSRRWQDFVLLTPGVTTGWHLRVDLLPRSFRSLQQQFGRWRQ